MGLSCVSSGFPVPGGYSITVNTGGGVHANIWGPKFTLNQYLGSVNYNMDKIQYFGSTNLKKGSIVEFGAGLQKIRLNISGSAKK